MPNSDTINTIVTRAQRYLYDRQGFKSFADALESDRADAAERTLNALYDQLADHPAIKYEYEPNHGYAPTWQDIRFHYEVVDQSKGTCIDLAVLFAACLENIHRNPLIILVKTGTNLWHAVIGCWRGEPVVRDPIIRDEQKIRQWLAKELIVLESKGYAQSQGFLSGMTFEHCLTEAANYIKTYPLCYALNIVGARDAGVMPMPFGKGVQFDRRAALAMFRARQEAERLGSGAVSARHLLLGLLSLDNSLLGKVLARFGGDAEENVKRQIEASFRVMARVVRGIKETDHWNEVKRQAVAFAQKRGQSLVKEADLLRALLDTPSQIDQSLEKIDLTSEKKMTREDCLMGLNSIEKDRGQSVYEISKLF